jgi:hypothetical protein
VVYRPDVKPDSSFRAVKEPWKQIEQRIILSLSFRDDFRLYALVWIFCYSSKTSLDDGGLDHDDCIMVERAN